MALCYGFNYLGWDKDKEFWDKKFKKLTDEERGFYHNVLPWLLMHVDIGHVSEKTIPEIIKRNAVYSIINEDAELTEDMLKKYIGFEANVETKTTNEWVKKFLRIKKLDKGPLATKGTIKKEWEAYQKNIMRVGAK